VHHPFSLFKRYIVRREILNAERFTERLECSSRLRFDLTPPLPQELPVRAIEVTHLFEHPPLKELPLRAIEVAHLVAHHAPPFSIVVRSASVHAG
jgi:hypothetical protein